MRICITRTHKNPYSATFIRNQIHQLSTLAEVVTLHTGRLPEKKEDGSLLNPFPFWILNKALKVVTGSPNNYFGHYGLKKFLAQKKVDVLLVNYGPSGALMTPISTSLGIPMVVHFHGYDATFKMILGQYTSRYLRMFDAASKIIAVSQDMKKAIVQLGAPESKVEVIPYGIDLTKFKPADDKSSNIVLAVGRFTAKKSPINTIKAFSKVLKGVPDCKLVMAGGKTDMFDECQALVRQLGIESSVEFPGVLTSEEISALMNKSAVFVQHSVTPDTGDMEGTPNSILEASACGLPVVSTEHGGIKEAVIHGKTGFLVPENDIDGMANYIQRLLTNPAEAESMGKLGRQHMEVNYELSKQIQKLYSVLEAATIRAQQE